MEFFELEMDENVNGTIVGDYYGIALGAVSSGLNWLTGGLVALGCAKIGDLNVKAYKYNRRKFADGTYKPSDFGMHF